MTDGHVSFGKFQWKGLADETRVKHARRVQRSFSFVICGAATEPGELVLQLRAYAAGAQDRVVAGVAGPSVEER